MFTALRSQSHSLFRYGVIAVVLVSWLVLLISATCAMPTLWRSVPELDSVCVEEGHHAPDSKGGHPSTQDCSFKPCLASPSSPGLAFDPPSLELPTVVLCLFWLTGYGLATLSLRLLRAADPPSSQRVPLIYRFCTLLN